MNTAKNTGRSIKGATTPREVYNALMSQITTKDAIVQFGEYADGIKIMQVGNEFVRENNSVRQCRTNKFLPTAADALKGFGAKVLSLSLEQAKAQAYSIRDAHCVNVSVWDDTIGKSQLLKGRPFNGRVADAPTEFTTKDGVVGSETRFNDVVLEEIAYKTSTASGVDLCLPDMDANEAEAAAALLKGAATSINAVI